MNVFSIIKNYNSLNNNNNINNKNKIQEQSIKVVIEKILFNTQSYSLAETLLILTRKNEKIIEFINNLYLLNSFPSNTPISYEIANCDISNNNLKNTILLIYFLENDNTTYPNINQDNFINFLLVLKSYIQGSIASSTKKSN